MGNLARLTVAAIVSSVAITTTLTTPSVAGTPRDVRALTTWQSALSDASIPASCGHPAARLRHYRHDFGDNGQAQLDINKAVHGRITGHRSAVTAVPLLCSASSATDNVRPELVLLYGGGAKLLGWTDLGKIRSAQEHETPGRLGIHHGKVTFRFDGRTGAGTNLSVYRGALGWRRGHTTWQYRGPLVITDNDSYNDNEITGPGEANRYFAPAPPALKKFLQHQWVKLESTDPESSCGATANVSLARYSHHGFAAGFEGACDGGPTVWGRVHGQWKFLLLMQDYPACDQMGATLRRAMTVLAQKCWKNNRVVTLGRWPRSGM